jgi:hypothetical protein
VYGYHRSANILRFCFHPEIAKLRYRIGGQLVKAAKFLSIAMLTIAVPVCFNGYAFAQPAPTAAGSPAMPEKWDPKIPLPPGAVLVSSATPSNGGVVHGADFMAAGDYQTLVDFYEAELPKAGFSMGPKIAIAARKVYNRNFSNGDSLDSVVISPSTQDPSKFSIHFAWTPPYPKPKSTP